MTNKERLRRYFEILENKIFLRLFIDLEHDHYKFTLMSFGLTNAQTTFMDMINHICKLYLDKFVIVCIDDVLIYSKTSYDHAKHLH